MKSMAAHSQPGAFKTTAGCIGKGVVWLLVVSAFPLVCHIRAADAPKAPVAATPPKPAAFLDWTHYLKLAEDGQWDEFGKLDGLAFRAHFWPQRDESHHATNAAYWFVCGSGYVNWTVRQQGLSDEQKQAHYRVALPLARQAAELGQGQAMAELAWMLAEGMGTTADRKAAVAWADRAAPRILQQFGTNSLSAARMVTELAVGVHARLGNEAKAEPLLRLAVNIQRSQLATNDVVYSGSLDFLAACLVRQTNFTAALPIFQDVRTVLKNLRGGSHPEYARACIALGDTLQALQKYQDAEVLFREAAAIYKQVGKAHEVSHAHTLARLGDVLTSAADPAGAEAAYLEMLPVYKNAFNTKSAEYLGALDVVMKFYKDSKNTAKAVPFALEKRDLQREMLGATAPQYGAFLHELGGWLRDASEMRPAKQIMLEAVSVQRKAHGDNHPDVANSLNRLGTIAYQMKEFEEGEQYNRDALRIMEANASASGVLHVHHIQIAENLAMLFEERGRLKEAIEQRSQLLKLIEKNSGPEHPDTASSLDRLAMLYHRTSDYAKAGPLYRRALTILEKVMGAEHPDTASSLSNLALLYFKTRDYTGAAPLWQRALKIREKVLGPEHLDTAVSLSHLAALYHRTSDYAKAEPLYQRALKIREKALGPEHPATRGSLLNLAELYDSMGDYAKAEPLFRQELRIAEKMLGSEHPDTIRRMDRLAEFFEASGNYVEAEPLLLRESKIVEKKMGPEHPDLAMRITKLAWIYCCRADYTNAEPLYQRALKIREKALGPEHGHTVASLGNLASVYQAMGDYAKAEVLLQRALKIIEKGNGPEHPKTASSLNDLALLYAAMSDYAKAESLYLRALKIREKALGPDNLATATCLNDLAALYKSMGNYAKAEPLYQRALKIVEKVRGPEASETAKPLNNLAELYRVTADYAKAEPLYQRSLKIYEKSFGFEHPYTAPSLNNLGLLYSELFDYAKAEPLILRALKIREKALGPEHPDTALILNSLAHLYQHTADYAKAEPLMQRALEVREKVLGPEHLETANSLNHLASLYCDMADHAKAEPLHERALKIREKFLGPDHPATAESLNNLAVLYFQMGDYAKTEPLMRRALKLHEKLRGADHPTTAMCLNNMATVHDAQGDPEKAVVLARRALDIEHVVLENAAAAQSERQQLVMARIARVSLSGWISFSQRAGRAPAELAEVELLWKGQVAARQQALRQLREGLQRSGDPAMRALFERLDETSRTLATLALGQAEPGPKAEQRLKRLAELTEQKEVLERDLARQSALFRQQQQQANLSLADLRAALARQPGTVLVDFVEYDHMNQPKSGQHTNTFENRLLAFVVRGDTPEVAMLELGQAAPLGVLVEQWRKGLVAGQESRETGRQLRTQVWEKLEPKLGGAKTVLLSLDGALSRLPFGALPGSKQGTYLVEEYAFAAIPIPRLLPQLIEEAAGLRTNATPSLLAVGDVDYGGDPGTAMDGARAGVRGKGSLSTWGNLPGTRPELDAVVARFKERFPAGAAGELRLAAATEQAFRLQVTSSRYVHLATHGFFAAKHDKENGLRKHLQGMASRMGDGAGLYGGRGVAGWNPGLLSGLVLAGANRGAEEGKDDGILTALEVESLDLRGVDLAVLSACETGLGKAAESEGVLGLQRAFQLAGARTTVTSLWKVPDEATRALMTSFYQRLWQGKAGSLEALRQAQLAMLRGQLPLDGKPAGDPNRGAQIDGAAGKRSGISPYYWAAFVLSGDWR